MNRLYTVVVAFAVLAGCSLSPVISNELSPEKYQLRAHGNTFSNRENLQKNMHGEAKKVCGHDNYAYEDSGKYEVLSNRTDINGQFTTISSLVLTRIVNCEVSS